MPRCSDRPRDKDQRDGEDSDLTRSVDLEPIDRLEEKLKLLVSMVERMKQETARAAEENQRLSHELDTMRGRARRRAKALSPS